MSSVKVETRIGRNVLSLESGKVAKQANGSVVVQYGDTVVLAAVVDAKPRMPVDFFPLRVDYREMTYAAGKFPGGFFKREGRPTIKEVLTSRLIDRPIRPLFPEGYNNEVMIQSIVLSADRQNDPDMLGMVGASAALVLAPDIPFFGPTGAVRVGRVDGELVLNPTHSELENSTMSLVVCGTEHAITMLEGWAQEVAEEDLLQAILFCQRPIADLVRIQRELAEAMGVILPTAEPPKDNPLLSELEAKYFDRVMDAHQVKGKFPRFDALRAIADAAVEAYASEAADSPGEQEIRSLFDKLERKACRTLILREGRREDGRGPTDIRPIECEVGVLPRVHGSALFTRGETQAIVTCTLGTSIDEQRVDGLEEEYRKKFLLHYNFPSFCVGEVRPPRGPSRREVGHGHLAEMSLQQVLPPVEDFPYTIRIVSDIMESNGSSSMASVCGGTLCLMDAGVPLRQPVAGVAMGLVTDGAETRILTDISGAEDHFGDMDFKIAGTQNGITGVQMDLKVSGIKEDTIMEALLQARDARIRILKSMLEVIERPRAEISRHAPRLLLIKIPPDKIGTVIGPGGRVIKKIQEETGATVDIADDGSVNVSSIEAEGAERARDMILALVEEPEIGKTYLGRVRGIKEFGAFVEILPGRDGLVHISELSDSYVKSVEDVCKLGDEMLVKLLSIDDQGKIRLSRRAALKEEQQEQNVEPLAE